MWKDSWRKSLFKNKIKKQICAEQFNKTKGNQITSEQKFKYFYKQDVASLCLCMTCELCSPQFF